MSYYQLAYHTAAPESAHLPVHGGIAVYTKVPGVYPSIAVGTLSGVVIERKTKRKLLLSNQHVFFPTGPNAKGQPGLEVYHSIAKVTDKPIAKTFLTKGERNPWPKGQENQAMKQVGVYHDSALAVPLTKVSMEVNNIGKQKSMVEPKKGMRIKYFGRTSRLQRGVITNPNVNNLTPVGNDKYSVRKGIVECDIKIQPGDSGSMVFTEDNHVLGLVFGHSGTRGYFCKASAIAKAYDVVFSEEEVGGTTEEESQPKPEPTPKPEEKPLPDLIPGFPNIDLSDRNTQILLAAGGIGLVLLVAGLTARR